MWKAALTGLCLLCVGGEAFAQRDDGKIFIQFPEPETTATDPMIGMAAYEEVLASGKYLVGPQDEFLIYVPGIEEPVIKKVLAEGSLFIPKVGLVAIGGLLLSEAHEKIEAAFRKTVKLGHIDVELSKPRSFPVPVLGLIKVPGTRLGSAVQRISQIVPVVGELDNGASTRNIRVFNPRRSRRVCSPAGNLGIGPSSVTCRQSVLIWSSTRPPLTPNTTLLLKMEMWSSSHHS
jgi:hypothetical protein